MKPSRPRSIECSGTLIAPPTACTAAGTTMTESAGVRRAGLLIPLFSCPSQASWGIGEIGDIEPMTAWLAAAGQRILQLLPINEMAPRQQSPYSAISAMAIDPIFISLRDVPDFTAIG